MTIQVLSINKPHLAGCKQTLGHSSRFVRRASGISVITYAAIAPPNSPVAIIMTHDNSAEKQKKATYKLEAAADGGLDVGAAEGGDLAELPGDLDGVVEEEAQATLVAEPCRAGDLSEQNCRAGGGKV